jgi:hypothetical protein
MIFLMVDENELFVVLKKDHDLVWKIFKVQKVGKYFLMILTP